MKGFFIPQLIIIEQYNHLQFKPFKYIINLKKKTHNFIMETTKSFDIMEDFFLRDLKVIIKKMQNDY